MQPAPKKWKAQTKNLWKTRQLSLRRILPAYLLFVRRERNCMRIQTANTPQQREQPNFAISFQRSSLYHTENRKATELLTPLSSFPLENLYETQAEYRYPTYESRTEATGYCYLLRQVCGQAAHATGEGGAFCGRSGGSGRSKTNYDLQLGSRSDRTESRSIPAACITIRHHKSPHSFARKIAFYKTQNPPVDFYFEFCIIPDVQSTVRYRNSENPLLYGRLHEILQEIKSFTKDIEKRQKKNDLLNKQTGIYLFVSCLCLVITSTFCVLCVIKHQPQNNAIPANIKETSDTSAAPTAILFASLAMESEFSLALTRLSLSSRIATAIKPLCVLTCSQIFWTSGGWVLP